MISLKNTITLAALTLLLIASTNSFAVNYFADAKNYYDKAEYQSAIIQFKNHLKEKPNDSNARLLLGKSYIEVMNLKQAEKEISRAYKLNPENDDIVFNYAYLLLLQGKYNKIEQLLDREFSAADRESQKQMYMGYVALGRNQLADAKQIFSDLIDSYIDVKIYIGLAKIAILENEMDLATQWANKSLELEPDNVDALETQAKVVIINENYEKALNIYNALISKHDQVMPLYLSRAAVKISLNDFKGAEEDVRIVLKEVKNQPLANYLLARIKLQQGNFKAARIAAEDVLLVIPDHYESMLALGIAHFSEGNYNLAEKYLTQFLSVYPDNLSVQNILAKVYMAKEEIEQAILILEGIDDEKKNNNVNILMTLGTLYLLSGEHQKGVEALNKANDLTPDNEQIQKSLIVGYFKTGDVDNAITALEKMESADQASLQTIYFLIVSYIQKDELEKAEIKLKELIKKAPKNPAFYNMLAIVEKLKGNNQKARDNYNQVLQLNDKYIPAYFGLAELATLEKDWDSAAKVYEKVITINPKYIKTYMYLAQIAEIQERPQDVEKYLMAGFEQSKGNMTSQITMADLLGNWYIKQKTPEKILPIADELKKYYLDDNLFLSFLVSAQIANNQIEQAEKTLTTIVKNDRFDVEHRLMLAGLLENQKDSELRVVHLLDDVINIIPNNSKPVKLKAAFLSKKGQYQDALEVADYAIEQFPQQAFGYQIRGDIYILEKDLENALSSYQSAYELQPYRKLLFIISDLLITQGDDDEAIMVLESALQNNENDLAIHFKLGYIYQMNKHYKKAAKQYLQMLEINQNNVQALNNLAWVYAQENNPQALSLAKKAYELAPKVVSVIDTYGYIQIKKGNLDEGIALTKDAVRLAPDDSDIKFHLAEGYYLKGEITKSKVILKTILATDKNFSEKDNAKALYYKLQ